MSHPNPKAGGSSSSTSNHRNQPCHVESCKVASACLPESKLLL